LVMPKIRVLVVDDSAFLRRALPRILESDPEITVVATASNGAEGVRLVKELRPDVVTLDVMMPGLDGLSALRQIMREAPTPVVMVSSLTAEGEKETLEALALGAVDFVTKPSGPVSLDIDKVSIELVEKIRAAYGTRTKVETRADGVWERFRTLADTLRSRDGSIEAAAQPESEIGGKRLIAIATSTGGPSALQTLLPMLPADLGAGIVVVQHIAAGFTKALAERLNDLSKITVREARDGEPILPGVALVSPADMHMLVRRVGVRLSVRLSREPAMATYRPSADVLFRSIASVCAEEACAVVLTGMGDDGALGLKAIRDGGGHTIAQDEKTSLIYGMPKWAVEMGGVSVSLPLDLIGAEIVRSAR
jgi:two-component system, chemotaxis family, protein-glutamate methylesterase/glutaminase